MDATKYNVIATGKVATGYTAKQVVLSFAKLYKIPPEKAQKILRERRVLKKDLETLAAEKLKTTLEGIGLRVELEKIENAAFTLDNLTLEPIETKQDEDDHSATSFRSIFGPLDSCPKCHTKIDLSLTQCPSCGVYAHKLNIDGVFPSGMAQGAQPQYATNSERAADSAGPKKTITGRISAAKRSPLAWGAKGLKQLIGGDDE